MAKRSKIEIRYNDKPPTTIHGSERLIVKTPSGQGFVVDIGHDAITVRVDGIEMLTVEPQGGNMVTLRRRRRS